jgi:lipopolysaccharide export system permease protein
VLYRLPPPAAAPARRPLGAYRAEAHEALSAPLYGLVFALIAVAFVVGPGFRRQGFLGRILLAAAVALGLRLAGLAAKGLATGEAALWPLMYLPPLVGAALALWLLSGRRLPARRRANGAAVPA